MKISIHTRRQGRHDGFTLIEVMIVVVIVGILAALAYPSYTQYVTRSQRQAARSALVQVGDRQEQFYLDNKRYAADLDELGMGGESIGLDVHGQFVGADADDITYTITVTAADDTSWEMDAVPQGMQASRDTECATLTLDNTGARSASGSGENCW